MATTTQTITQTEHNDQDIDDEINEHNDNKGGDDGMMMTTTDEIGDDDEKGSDRMQR